MEGDLKVELNVIDIVWGGKSLFSNFSLRKIPVNKAMMCPMCRSFNLPERVLITHEIDESTKLLKKLTTSCFCCKFCKHEYQYKNVTIESSYFRGVKQNAGRFDLGFD